MMSIMGNRKYSILFAVLAVVLLQIVARPYFAEAKAEAEKPSDVEGVGEAGKPDTSDEAVVTLTTANFDAFLEEHEVVLVEFYAPWCGHCKRLAPEYEAAAKKLAADGHAVKLGKVDATVEGSLADKFGVRGYPTLQLFRKKVPEEYSGGRTADTIVDWLTKMTGPAVTTVEDAELKTLIDSKPAVAFVGKFKSTDADLHKHFVKVADANRQAGRFVAHIASGNKDEIVVYRGDEDSVTFAGKTDEELRNFVAAESFALFGPINGENFKNYAERSQEMIWYCGGPNDFDSVKAPVRQAAKKFREEYSFVWLDTEQFKGHAENALGVSEFPALVCQTKKGRFVLPDISHTSSADKIIQFLDDVKNGKIEKNLKSEPIPEANEDSVKVVVGKNFEDLVLQENKDVFLEVYAPWCGHCKKLEPVYVELANSLKEVNHIVIAKMDGTANESPVEDFDWTGFPTVYFVKAGTKTPMKFDGARTLEGMMEYIKKHSSKGIKDEDIKLEPEAAPAASGRAEEL